MNPVYEYRTQAWVQEGKYVPCGHQTTCGCYGKQHAGEAVYHREDRHCQLVDDQCEICGVLHGDPCPGCGGRGFHNAGCNLMDVEELFEAGEKVEVYDLGSRGGVWVKGTVATPDDGSEYVTVNFDGGRMAFLRTHVRHDRFACLECNRFTHVIGCSRMDVPA